jgi:hypothetical protein
LLNDFLSGFEGCGHSNGEMSDCELLREYVDAGSEIAFSELAQHHLDYAKLCSLKN